jgi:hypothetical protein
MSKKTLLEESSVRKFMKLANLSPMMSSNFITETYGSEDDMSEQAEEVELDMKEGAGHYMEDEEGMADMSDDMPMDDDMDMDDDMGMDDDMAAEGAEVEMSEDEVLKVVDAVAQAISDITGHSVMASSDDGPEDAGMDFEPAEEPMDAMGDDQEELEEINLIDEEAVVNETYRRVAQRLSALNKEEKLVERLAQKLQKRFTAKR